MPVAEPDAHLLPPRSTAGQLTLDQHIGVRIPGGQPIKSRVLAIRLKIQPTVSVLCPYSLRRIQSRSFGCNHLVLRTWTASSTVFGLSAATLLANSTMVNTAATVAFMFLGIVPHS